MNVAKHWLRLMAVLAPTIRMEVQDKVDSWLCLLMFPKQVNIKNAQ